MRREIMGMRVLPSFLAVALLVGLSGCGMAARDSWNDQGTWRGTGVNDTNLQAMIANPNDLVAGQGDRGSSGVVATTAVNRYLTDKVKQLPEPGGLTINGASSSNSGGGQASAPQ
jgi:type IV pilus biogenesis protein CpaD/CtpE